jgi:hypothetical protein
VSTSACRCFTLQLPSSLSVGQPCEAHMPPSTSSASAVQQHWVDRTCILCTHSTQAGLKATHTIQHSAPMQCNSIHVHVFVTAVLAHDLPLAPKRGRNVIYQCYLKERSTSSGVAARIGMMCTCTVCLHCTQPWAGHNMLLHAVTVLMDSALSIYALMSAAEAAGPHLCSC